MYDGYFTLQNPTVVNAFVKASVVIPKHDRIAVSISGGSDSDIVMDMVEKIKTPSQTVEYVWFDTGLEYQATKDHLVYLENKYGVEIHRERAIKPIPTCVREYGVPFLSKQVSEHIEALQRHNFKWEDRRYEDLLKEYPKCKKPIGWWCNEKNRKGGTTSTQFNIKYNKWLKEFMIANPPTFKISCKCCTYAKKKPAKMFYKAFNSDLSVVGVRKAEGGVRAFGYENCYTEGDYGKTASFRPIFWFTNEDKRFYEEAFGICHSECYTRYGLKRTGCVGCPYGRNVLDELEATKKFEPKVHKACMTVFGQAYEYTRQYRKFCEEMNYKEKLDPDQMTLEDLFYDFAEKD